MAGGITHAPSGGIVIGGVGLPSTIIGGITKPGGM
jgi:hypothetical protein